MAQKNVLLEILSETHVLVLVLLTLGAIVWVYANGGPFDGGLKFGIDFSGGLRIPILLEQPVDPLTMQEMVDNIKTRATTFGLAEVRVTPVGDSQIYVEVPKTNPGLAANIENLLSKQGIYQGIVDGKVAVSGESVYPATVRRDNPSYYGAVDWVVAFSLTPEGQQHFTQTVRGKGNYPLYMFLDRPNDAIIVISREDLLATTKIKGSLLNITDDEAIKNAINALNLQNSPLPIYIEEDLNKNINNSDLKPATNSTKAIISENSSLALQQKLKGLGFNVVKKPKDQMQPTFLASGANLGYIISRWDAVGLKSSPILAPAIADGAPSSSYVITGTAKGFGNARALDADYNAREIMSILKGGALPVQISLGSVEEVPARLGQEVLRLSLIGLIFSVFCISIMLAVRYRSAAVVLPIIFVSISEIILLLSIIGFFSIDLAAMAGLIATVGVSVDAQIIITDDMLKRKEGEDPSASLDKAFHIIMTNAIVAIVAMAPLLLFSGLVEIIGFATTTVIGYMLGVFISRPAYGVVARKLFFAKKHESVKV